MAPSLIPWCESEYSHGLSPPVAKVLFRVNAPTNQGEYGPLIRMENGGLRSGAPHTVLHISCMHLRHLTSAETSRHERCRTKRGPKSHPPQRRLGRSRQIPRRRTGTRGPTSDHGEGQGTGRAATRDNRHPESRRGRLARSRRRARLPRSLGVLPAAVARANRPADDPAIKKVIGPDGRTGGDDRTAAPSIPQGVN